MQKKGKVYIIGVGPGDYKLATIKAVECIGRADVVVYDRLIGSKLLSHAREDAELIYVGKMPDRHVVPQHEINRILVEKALEGKTVARVKGGDPFVFGRGGEEAEELRENGIEFEIIPGVTSSIAVPAYAGIPVTHRDFCSSFHIITGHERAEKGRSIIDYEALAKVEGTLIFLMGVKNLPEITANLMKYGKKGSTPAAVIEKGTTAEQRVVAGTVEDIAGKVLEAGVKSPAVTVIGDVVRLREKLGWFPGGRLAGKRVVVTRAREQASKLVEKIEQLGGEAIEFPTIKIAEPEDYAHFDRVLDSLGSFRWIVFTSVNGVDAFFNRMKEKRMDIRSLYGVKLCAVGEATGEHLNRMGLNVDYMPEKFTTACLLKGLLDRIKPGEKVLLARADIGSEELSDGLRENGIEFDDLAVYRTVAEAPGRDEIVELMEEGRIDFITFTSSSTVRNFVSILGRDKLDKINKAKTVCIGPVTAKTAVELGIEVASVADVYTIDGLVEKLAGEG
ncbi:MAG: uroporphyrinogen-III C-methyltransferase [Clostridiales bacterium]|nr:uroporphyrinogen-III C-methyltransferase [Eubacteriales bacterium]MDH7565735.1 uroporphyrinogen-III C-methyltransferase [Clostridiales bacterium]